MRRFLAVAAISALITTPLFAASFLVNSLGDTPDATPGDGACATTDAGTPCTLRAAIMETNALAGADNIAFVTAGTIAITAGLPLPPITDPVIISGPGAAGAAPTIIVDGGGVVTNGFDFTPTSTGSQVHRLEIRGFTGAAVISTRALQLSQNYIGPVSGGTRNGTGVLVTAGRASLGATGAGGAAFRNVISGNGVGIHLNVGQAVVINNYIGTNAAGTAALPNDTGVVVTNSDANFIGDATAFNIISGNSLNGVTITGSNGTTVAGNRIGTDVTGLVAIPNAGVGISVDGSQFVAIGDPTRRNIISGNLGTGVLNRGLRTTLENNYIGVGADGMTAIPNQWGIVEQGSQAAIGTTTAGNVISGNLTYGIEINATAAFTVIVNNRIGVDATGNVAKANGVDGIFGNGNTTTTARIGGTAAGEGNVISGNTRNGIYGEFPFGIIRGNLIGLNAAGTAAIPNVNGIHTDSGSSLQIGGLGTGGNTISGNTEAGIRVDGTASGVSIHDNRIGTNAAGTAAVANRTGIDLLSTSGLDIRFNVISGNTTAGIDFQGTTNNVEVQGNIIGRNAANTAGVPNNTEGLRIRDASTAITVGAPGSGNIIASNFAPFGAVLVTGSATALIRANSIFDNSHLGIDLEGSGVTPNDLLDADTGANMLQNFPVLTSAASSATQSYVSGTLNSTPSTTFTLDFFSNSAPDPSGHGEGETYIGSMDVTTDASGNASFSFVGSAVPLGRFFTSTATAATGTSEFSGPFAVAALATVQFSSATYAAGESDGTATITVTRSGDLTATSSVAYTTSDGTATAGSDYTSVTGTITFAPGVATQTFTVTLLTDTTDEADETVTLTLSSPSVADLGTPATATLTITDDDGTPSITIGDVTLAEGNAGATAFNFTVTLSNPSSSAVTVDYATADGTATDGSDYTAATGTLTIPAGATSGTITVNVTGNTAFEPDETFLVNLTNATNAAITDAQALGTITNDDVAPTLTIGDVTQAEGNSGPTTFNFVVTLSTAISSDVSVTYATANGTATAGSDYTAATGTLTIAAGATSGTIAITVAGDADVEPNETFFVNLTAPVNATIADAQAVGTITNEDVAVAIPTLSEWMLMALAIALAALAVLRIRA